MSSSDEKLGADEKRSVEQVSPSAVENGSTRPYGADAALDFLHHQVNSSPVVVDVDEKRLVRKIDLMIVPLMWFCYFLQYLDKTLINYANVMGLQPDTGTTPTQFSHLALVFYVSYLFCEPIHAYLMQRYPTAKYLGIQVICWGVRAKPLHEPMLLAVIGIDCKFRFALR